ncbi:MAG: hypothetical protein QOJ11_1897 [Frankiales bacterium]|nr:hypothetical protein [Frankiales bacterium]
MVTEELSSGPEKSGRPWALALIVCLCLLATVALLTKTGGHAKTAPTPQVPKLTVPTGSAEITLPPAPSQPPPTDGPIGNRTAPPSGSPAFVPSRLDGVAAKIPKGVRLLLGGHRPTVLGGNAHQFSHVPIDAHQEVTGIVPVKEGFVVQVQDEAALNESALAVYWVRADGKASLVTNTDVVIPAQAGDRIFAYATGAGNAVPLAKQVGRLSEVTLAGRVVATHTLAAGLVPLADSPQGLVFSDLARDKVEIRDRRTLAVRKDLATAEAHVAVDHGWLVSSADPFCNVSCRLTVQNLATAKRYQVAIADHLYVGEVAVNPNGRSVAISYWGAQTPGSVVVADLAGGAVKRIPGVVTESRRVADIAWTPDGRTLAVSVTFTDHDLRRIALWPVNGRALKVLPDIQQGATTPWSLAAF